MTTKTAYIEERQQKSVGRNAQGFGGPDTYVSVQVVPEGVERLKTLRHSAAKKRGIELIYCGEGYASRDKTPRSALWQARAKAAEVAARINEEGGVQ